MIFNEITYFLLFLAPSVLLFHLAKRSWKPWVLTVFGIAFFAWFAYLHFGRFWGSTCVLIFVWELLVSRFYKPRSWVCILGIVQAVAFLCVFKYLPFFATAWDDAFAASTHGLVWKLFLPLGLSFFTFEFIHFAADSYAGRIQDAKLGEYAAFIFFFPSMVAGPLKRFQQFRRELTRAHYDSALFSRGVTRILAGLAKKHVLADTFALFFVPLQGNVSSLGRAQVAGGLLAYGMRIYLDFSGYSDIAIGSGMLFGIVLPENFRWPYCSRDIAEFWRRWHVSLSQWIRDYVYVPLGGSRRGEWRTRLNVMMAFGISGLWHGAGYNFLIWGLWHGAMLVMFRQWQVVSRRANMRMPVPIAQLVTFAGVTLGWAFFSLEIRQAWRVLRVLVLGSASG
jgi:alginate O-acetyltransferase complex protein AlgI